MFSLVALKKVEELEHKSQVVRGSQVLKPGNDHIYPTKIGTFESMVFPNFPGGICDRPLEGKFCLGREKLQPFWRLLSFVGPYSATLQCRVLHGGKLFRDVSKGFWNLFAFQEGCMVRGFVVSWIHYILHCTGQHLKIDLNASQNKLSGRASESLVRPVLWSSKWLPLPQSNMSNEKKGPLGVYGYMSGIILPSYVGNIS